MIPLAMEPTKTSRAPAGSRVRGCKQRSKAAQIERIQALSVRERLLLAARVSAAAREMRRLGQGTARGG
jgi:hypothetical protein